MSRLSTALAHIELDDVEKCLLCFKTLINKSTKQAITVGKSLLMMQRDGQNLM